MLLDQPVDKAAIAKMSELERVELLQQAYREFIDLVHTVKDQQKTILEDALHEAERQKIEEIYTVIQSLPS